MYLTFALAAQLPALFALISQTSIYTLILIITIHQVQWWAFTASLGVGVSPCWSLMLYKLGLVIYQTFLT